MPRPSADVRPSSQVPACFPQLALPRLRWIETTVCITFEQTFQGCRREARGRLAAPSRSCAVLGCRLAPADDQLHLEAVRLRDAGSPALPDHATDLLGAGAPALAHLAVRLADLGLRLGERLADHARHLAVRRWW